MNHNELVESVHAINAAAQQVLSNDQDSSYFETSFHQLRETVFECWPEEGCMASEWDKDTDVMQESFRCWIVDAESQISSNVYDRKSLQAELREWIQNIEKYTSSKKG